MEKLEIAEYVSLAGSALGSVVAVASGQVVYAAVPLTVALALNLVNRRQFQQQTWHHSRSAITQANQIIQSLQQQVEALPAINRQMLTLDQEFSSRPEKKAIEQLEQAVPQLTEQLDTLKVRVNNLPTAKEVDLSEVEQAITYINEELSALTRRLDQQPTPKEVDLTGLEEAIASIYGQLDTLYQQFNARPETKTLEHLEGVISQLQEQLNAVTLHLDQLPTPQAVDLTNLEEAD